MTFEACCSHHRQALSWSNVTGCYSCLEMKEIVDIERNSELNQPIPGSDCYVWGGQHYKERRLVLYITMKKGLL